LCSLKFGCLDATVHLSLGLVVMKISTEITSYDGLDGKFVLVFIQ